MIPSIETIVEDVVAGRITKSQAVTWLYAHAEGAANELRDHFAASALPTVINLSHNRDGSWDAVAASVAAYAVADAMMEARKEK